MASKVMHRFATLAAALVVGACAPAASRGSVRAPSAAEVAQVLDELHAAAARADERRYFALFAEDAVFLGTDQSERWGKAAFRAYAHPHFAKGKAWSFRAVRRDVAFSPDGTTAWFDEDLETEKLGPARGSGVLALREGRWQLVQYNLALTIPNERFDLVRRALVSARAAAPATDALAAAAWLSGAWQAERPNGELVEESWSTPNGGTMVGSGRSVAGGKTTFFELLRIESRPDGVFFVAQPMGGAKVEFRARTAGADELVFENPAHDWPKRVSYRRVPEGVRVRVEGDASARVEEWTYVPAFVAAGGR